ncbi:hypothetical protein CDAR_439291 [Caerostris darwini]|uniref:Uncharacterized protein n=1 Tax=Caerostris darwini TaxID=1538125 RepID=A0AAV4MKB3_9ARAC|nr:hypothetical protein CDAR_439291 [Caerostris darwini]
MRWFKKWYKRVRPPVRLVNKFHLFNETILTHSHKLRKVHKITCAGHRHHELLLHVRTFNPTAYTQLERARFSETETSSMVAYQHFGSRSEDLTPKVIFYGPKGISEGGTFSTALGREESQITTNGFLESRYQWGSEPPNTTASPFMLLPPKA